MLTVLEFLDRDGASPFGKVVRRARRHRRRTDRDCRAAVGAGEFLHVKGVEAGVWEYRIDFGPGYRVYFGKDGEAFVILPGGGTKKRQDRGHRNGARTVEGLQEAQVAGDLTMPLTREFKDTVQARIEAGPQIPEGTPS